MVVTVKKTFAKRVEVPKRIKTGGEFNRWYAEELKKLELCGLL